ncbi:polyphosphate polymerase domain-containing protein [Candidatus Saccharibacteria bacterium]|nr:polyphosphate polymerase domain-containing protein [Candidatus Saccharibacteria bacterium]MBR3204738.1 polyphosphate polymerase domain-containing protein [Candidatus Saccharibacteria bacterium]
MDIDTIQRVEEKYLISSKEQESLLKSIEKYLKKDKYFSEKVFSLYFDTKNNDFVIKSIDRPAFREKIRVRAYNIPKKNTKVFLEIKSKLAKGRIKIGNKRRLSLKLGDFYDFQAKKENLVSILKASKVEEKNQYQIAEELDYLLNFYSLEPKIIISSDRTAYSSKENDNFRLTFDKNLSFRTDDLRLEKQGNYEQYFKNTKDKKHCIIMEVKTMNAMPIWFVKELSKRKIYPSRFSKYGKIYQQITERQKNV